jgi:hypothetical protein
VSVSEVGSGRRLNINVPPSSPWAALNEAGDAYRKLVQERSVTGRRLSGLEGERARAIEQDRIEYAKALKEGKGDPGNKRVEKLEKEIAACRRRLTALEEAIDMATDDLIATIDEHRDKWAEEVGEALTATRQAYAEAVEALAEARAKVDTKHALLSFILGFPEHEITYRVRGSFVGALKAQNGDPYYFAQVVDALRTDAQMTAGAPEVHRSRDPLAQHVQAVHEERLANERAGHGYFTGDELRRQAENPVEFDLGSGTRVSRRMPRPAKAGKQSATKREEQKR